MRLGGVDHLAGDQQLHCAPLSDEAREALAAAVAGKKSKLALRLAEFGGIRRDADVTRHRQLAPAAQGESIDSGDHRLGAGLDSAEHVLTSTSASLRENGSLAR